MLTYSYYPFKKNFEELEALDLSTLRAVAEGWYIEYKSQAIKQAEFAKHLAAFANQYGGFLFIGIKEADDHTRYAGAFPGIDNNELHQLSIQIREASSVDVNPPILYEEKIINGPCEELGLPANRSIVIIGIPKSINTPHIHSSGRIYRRLADHSDPKPENDRHILDDLWNRGEAHRLKVSKFLSETPLLPKAVSSNPWIYIYLRPDENRLHPNKLLSFHEFCEVVTNNTNKVAGITAHMDAIYSAPNGFSARQTKNNDPTLPTLTYRWWFDGTARLEIPLNKLTPAELAKNEKYQHAKRFLEIASQSKFEHATVVDYSYLLSAASALANIHLTLCELRDDKRDIYSCFILKNIAFTSPYLDTEKFLRGLEQFSLPLTIDDEIRQPKEPSQSNMFHHALPNAADELHAQAKPFIFMAPIISWILHSVGATQEVGDWTNDEEMWSFLNAN